MGSNSVLCDIIAARIAASGKITFAEYIDLVLYHPEQGYYTTGAANIGSQGDFFTSPHLGADFGELLAEQFVDMWGILGSPKPFSLVEMGAGQGLVAADVLRYLQRHYPDFFDALEYIIVEKAAGMIAQQQQLLQRLAPAAQIQWSTLEEIADASIIGCCFSNELVDALPVHQIVLEGGQLREIYVTTGAGEKRLSPTPPYQAGDATGEKEFVEVTAELSTPQLAEYFDLVGIDLTGGVYPDGYRSEVNLAGLDWLKKVADKLQRGYILTIDYGYPANRYYNPVRHQGTLQCYYQHRHHDDPYIYIGHQDITAHVDFTALERQGKLCGLQRLGFTKQALFLMALGLGERIASVSTASDSGNQGIQEVLRRRDALHQLIDPMGLGGFGVLVQSQGLSEEEKVRSLKGLTMPPMS
ncbi:MAG: class I SAM-dependent methyltransferase [Aphanothece sp. CMT-3BRIN-NPC111]|nr:class I SAM-dependent methyltransferase [Aphanothece sp. CMT-3BRIN-NPC111]